LIHELLDRVWYIQIKQGAKLMVVGCSSIHGAFYDGRLFYQQ